MATEIALPQWGMEMQDGTIVRWLKEEGDPIQQGEPLVEIETAKLTTEMESTTAGILAHILVQVGETVPVRTALAIVAAPGEIVARPERTNVEETNRGVPAPASTLTISTSASRSSTQVTPIARRLAKEHDIDLNAIQGTGPRGRISEADVRRSIDSAPQTDSVYDINIHATKVVPLTGMRGAIAQRMSQSTHNSAAVTLTSEIDVTELIILQHKLVAEWRGHHIRPMELEFIVIAVARALKHHPLLNAVLVDNEIRELSDIDIGVAMAISNGLLVPVIKDTGHKNLLQIAQEIREVAKKSRENSLSPEETMGGTFTITTLGAFDIDAFTPIINPPQVGILGTGRIVKKPVVHSNEIIIRSMMHLSLTFDHRALDGAPAAEFLSEVKRSLEDPQWMTG